MLPSVPSSVRARRVAVAVAFALVVLGAVAPGAVRLPVSPSASTPLAAGTSDLPQRHGSAAVAATAPATVPSVDPTPTLPPAELVRTLSSFGIPVVALDAYHRSASRQASDRPGCHLTWPVVAAIGAVESGHGTHGGAQLYADGSDVPHVVGIALDGTSSAAIPDTDHGTLDGDPVWDHAVGPMQFIPSTWARTGVDGNGDGVADPFNVYDAAATTGVYLCHGGQDLATSAGLQAAVFGYNHLDAYVTTVLALAAVYAGGVAVGAAPAGATPPATATTTPAATVPTSGAPSSPDPTSSSDPTSSPDPTSSSDPTGTDPTCPAPGDPSSPSSSPGASDPSAATAPTAEPSCPGTGGPTGSSTDPSAAASDTSSVAGEPSGADSSAGAGDVVPAR